MEPIEMTPAFSEFDDFFLVDDVSGLRPDDNTSDYRIVKQDFPSATIASDSGAPCPIFPGAADLPSLNDSGSGLDTMFAREGIKDLRSSSEEASSSLTIGTLFDGLLDIHLLWLPDHLSCIYYDDEYHQWMLLLVIV